MTWLPFDGLYVAMQHGRAPQAVRVRAVQQVDVHARRSGWIGAHHGQQAGPITDPLPGVPRRAQVPLRVLVCQHLGQQGAVLCAGLRSALHSICQNLKRIWLDYTKVLTGAFLDAQLRACIQCNVPNCTCFHYRAPTSAGANGFAAMHANTVSNSRSRHREQASESCHPKGL